jgi:AcrR family transcriptional regulator
VSVSAQSRSRILDAARLCFVDRGYDQTTMKDIAAAAEMTVGAL